MSYAQGFSDNLAVTGTFLDVASDTKQNTKPKYPPPFSLRLTYEEKERLKAELANSGSLFVDNNHITIHEISDFMADDVLGHLKKWK